MYIAKSDFGWNRRTGWLHGDEASYNNAVALMKTVQPGRQRTRPTHTSWNGTLENFNPSDPTRSQGAFCRWANLNRGTFSAMQCKPLPIHIAELVGVWNAQGKEVENG